MILDKNKRILIVGLGLMGGSYAAALKRKGYHVDALTVDRTSIDFALENKMIDYGTTVVSDKVVGEADIVIFALYPHIFIDWIKNNQQYFKSGAIISDVTGVKCSIVYKIQSILRDDVEFISAHPMAGREVYGVQNSLGVNFSDANFIITPTDRNTENAIKLAQKLGEEIGFAKTSILTPEDHDEIIAFVSQLTHCIAISLMTCNNIENLEDYTGNSFRDLTRIARINEDMWSELFMLNKTALLNEMELFLKQFNKLKAALEKDDTESVKEIMRSSTERRAAFDKNLKNRKEE